MKCWNKEKFNKIYKEKINKIKKQGILKIIKSNRKKSFSNFENLIKFIRSK